MTDTPPAPKRERPTPTVDAIKLLQEIFTVPQLLQLARMALQARASSAVTLETGFGSDCRVYVIFRSSVVRRFGVDISEEASKD